MYPQYMCILLYVTLFGVTVFHRSIVNCQLEWGYMYPQYMCIPICDTYLCNGISEIYCQLEWRVDVSSVYVHSAICDTYLV